MKGLMGGVSLFLLAGCAFKANNDFVKYSITDEELGNIEARTFFSDSVDTSKAPYLTPLNRITTIKIEKPRFIYSYLHLFNLKKKRYWISQEFYDGKSKLIAQHGMYFDSRLPSASIYLSQCIDSVYYGSGDYYAVYKLNHKRVAENRFTVLIDTVNYKSK